MRGICVGRLDESDGHVVLTRMEQSLADSAKTSWKPPSSARSSGKDQESCSRSSFVSSRTLRCYLHLTRVTDADQLAEDRVAQRGQMEGLVDEKAKAEVTRPFRSFEDDNNKDVKRQRLGEPLAANPEEIVGVETSDIMTGDTAPLDHEETRREEFNKKTSREPEELSDGSREPKRIRTACLRVSNCRNHRQEAKKVSWKGVRFTSNMCWTLELRKIGATKIRSRQGRKSCQEDLWMTHTWSSRSGVREFATYQGPSVLAAASDVDNTSPSIC